MYLHLGQDTVVRTCEVVGIFDIENASVAKATRGYLAAAERAGQVVNVSLELPKSFVVCCPQGRRRQQVVYISQISSATLRKRAGFIEDISNV